MFELAKSGKCKSVAEIMRRLPEQNRETVETHLAQPSNRREVILICSDAWLRSH